MDAFMWHFKRPPQKKTFFAGYYLMLSFICLKQAANGVCHPGCFPKWELVYYYFTKWKNYGIIERINELIRNEIRKKAGKYESPSLACIDSQFG